MMIEGSVERVSDEVHALRNASLRAAMAFDMQRIKVQLGAKKEPRKKKSIKLKGLKPARTRGKKFTARSVRIRPIEPSTPLFEEWKKDYTPSMKTAASKVRKAMKSFVTPPSVARILGRSEKKESRDGR